MIARTGANRVRDSLAMMLAGAELRLVTVMPDELEFDTPSQELAEPNDRRYYAQQLITEAWRFAITEDEVVGHHDPVAFDFSTHEIVRGWKITGLDGTLVAAGRITPEDLDMGDQLLVYPLIRQRIKHGGN